ncbi:signal peptidase I [Candidatus Saccharibacteria bacterium]|nr:signal peptidase I [Candidatus Saccharibacteria bacterium]
MDLEKKSIPTNDNKPVIAKIDLSKPNPKTKKTSLKSLSKGLVKNFIMPIGLLVFVHLFVFQPFNVSGHSMEPNISEGDYLIITKAEINLAKLASKLGINGYGVKRGDIIVLRFPSNPDRYFIKRVIGLPNERLVISQGKVTIYNQQNPNGFTLDEYYIDPSQTTLGDQDVQITDDNFFVIGDNRSPNGSYDSRSWGLLPYQNIVGISRIRVLPSEHFGSTASADY